MKYVQASYKSLYGEVTSYWRKTGKGTQFTITIPANCTAKVSLPDGRQETVISGTHLYEIGF